MPDILGVGVGQYGSDVQYGLVGVHRFQQWRVDRAVELGHRVITSSGRWTFAVALPDDDHSRPRIIDPGSSLATLSGPETQPLSRNPG